MATATKSSGLTAVKKLKPNRHGGSPEKSARNIAILAEVTAGATHAEVAAKNRVTRERVGRIVRRALKAAAPSGKVERNAAIAAEPLAGGRPGEVAAKHGIGSERVRQIVKRVAPDDAATPRGEPLRAAIVADADTMTPKQIAAKHGVTVDYVRTVKRLAGKTPTPVPVITNVPKRPLSRAQLATKVVALATTRTTAQIAGHLNVSTKRVRNALKRAGVKAKRPSYTRYFPPRTIDPHSMQSPIVGLAGDHTVEQIAGIIGKKKAYVRAALKSRRAYAKDQQRPLRSKAPPSVPDIAAAAVATKLAKPFVPLPEPLAVARTVPNFGRDEAAERWPYVSPAVLESLRAEGRKIIADEKARLKAADTDCSIDALRKAFPEFEIPATEHLADFALISRPAPAAAPVEVFVKPTAAYVAEVVSHHSLDAAIERWPFLPTDQLFELNREGRALMAPPADEPLQALGVRIWRAIKRLVGRS